MKTTACLAAVIITTAKPVITENLLFQAWRVAQRKKQTKIIKFKDIMGRKR